MDHSKNGAQCCVPTCDVHEDEELDVYCYTCKKSICFECIKNVHVNHEYDKISKIAKKFRREIPTLNHGKTEMILNQHRRYLETLTKSKEITQDKIEDTIKRMNDHKASVHALVDSLTEEMVLMCRENGHDRKLKIENCMTRHRKIIEEIEESLAFVQESSGTLSDNILVQQKIEFEKKLEQSSEMDHGPHEDELFYVEGEIIEDNLKSMVGVLIPNDPSKVDVRQRIIFAAGDMTITTVVPVSHDSAWISKFKSTKLELVDIKGRVKQTKQLDNFFKSFDIDGNGDIFGSSSDRKIIKLDRSGSITTVMDTAPLVPLGVRLMRNGDLLVTLTDKSKDYEPKHGSRRIVQHIKASGEVVTTYEFDTDGSTRLFTYPRRARYNYNGDICVVDGTGYYTGRLCVLGIDGVMKFIYNGQNLKQKFLPTDVVCDYTSNIIVNDMNNYAIHLLSPSGDYDKYLTNDVTEFTQALGLYQSALWVGCKKGLINVFTTSTK